MLGYPATRIFLKQPGHLVVPRPETQRENLTSALSREIFGLHPSFSRIDRRTTSKRIESYATVYHDVAQTFKNLMPAFLKSNTAGTVSPLERQSMVESSQRMSEVGKVLTGESDAFDDALKPYQSDSRVSAALTTFSNEGRALQAIAQQYK